MLYTEIQPQSFLSSGEDCFKCFTNHILAWQPSCSMAQNHADKLSPSYDRRPIVKSGDNCLSGLQKKIFRLHDFIHVYRPGARADNHQNNHQNFDSS